MNRLETQNLICSVLSSAYMAATECDDMIDPNGALDALSEFMIVTIEGAGWSESGNDTRDIATEWIEATLEERESDGSGRS